MKKKYINEIKKKKKRKKDTKNHDRQGVYLKKNKREKGRPTT